VYVFVRRYLELLVDLPLRVDLALRGVRPLASPPELPRLPGPWPYARGGSSAWSPPGGRCCVVLCPLAAAFALVLLVGFALLVLWARLAAVLVGLCVAVLGEWAVLTPGSCDMLLKLAQKRCGFSSSSFRFVPLVRFGSMCPPSFASARCVTPLGRFDACAPPQGMVGTVRPFAAFMFHGLHA
jgi:hypothetical protein